MYIKSCKQKEDIYEKSNASKMRDFNQKKSRRVNIATTLHIAVVIAVAGISFLTSKHINFLSAYAGIM